MNPDQKRAFLYASADRVMWHLVEGNFKVAAARSHEGRWSAEDLRREVEGLGAPIVVPPIGEREVVEFVPSAEAGPGGFRTVLPFWTAAGRTDVGLAMFIRDNGDGTFTASIDDFVAVDAAALPEVPWDPPLEPPPPDDRPPPDYYSPVPERWRPVLAGLIHRLVLGEYTGLAADGYLSYTDDPTDDSIGEFIEDYPGTLVALPEEGWAWSDHWPEPDGNGWYVRVDLWTAESRHSDLTLEARVWDDGEHLVVKIQNVHVM